MIVLIEFWIILILLSLGNMAGPALLAQLYAHTGWSWLSIFSEARNWNSGLTHWAWTHFLFLILEIFALIAYGLLSGAAQWIRIWLYETRAGRGYTQERKRRYQREDKKSN